MTLESEFDAYQFNTEFEKLFIMKNANMAIRYIGYGIPYFPTVSCTTLDIQEQLFLVRYINAEIGFQLRHAYAEFLKALKANLNFNEGEHYTVFMNPWKITMDEHEDVYLYTYFKAANSNVLNTPAIYKE